MNQLVLLWFNKCGGVENECIQKVLPQHKNYVYWWLLKLLKLNKNMKSCYYLENLFLCVESGSYK